MLATSFALGYGPVKGALKIIKKKKFLKLTLSNEEFLYKNQEITACLELST